MFELDWIDDLDADGACTAVAGLHRRQVEAEAQMVYLAAHWADLHSGDGLDAREHGRPGRQRAVRLGGHGTPEVGEFAAAELGALQGLHPLSARCLVRDALDLRHRHPMLWQRVVAGQVRVWVARKIVQSTHELDEDQSRWVDAQTAEYADALPVPALLDLVTAKVIEADPAAAEARARAAEAEQFVAAGRHTEHGLKTLVARASAGDVIWFLAMVDRIAEILAERGDGRTIGVRRAAAVGILAQPAKALALLEDAAHLAEHVQHAEHADRREGGGPVDEPAAGPMSEGDVHPGDNDAEETTGDRAPVELLRGHPGASRRPRPHGKPGRAEPATPPVILYLHLAEEAVSAMLGATESPRTDPRAVGGVARLEGVGPLTLRQARELCGHGNVTITPVLDLADERAVDAYEVPGWMREALALSTPRDVFPFATHRGRRRDHDHSTPYTPPADGGPPGQTRLSNLGPLVRFHHRLRTHGGWQVCQPHRGVHLWRSPHGWYWVSDHTGTRRLPRGLGDDLWRLRTGTGADPPGRAAARSSPTLTCYPGSRIEYEPAAA